MGLSCQVKRNEEGRIEQVLAFNEKPSKLYETIKTKNPGFTESQALREYAKFYTPAFLERFGNFIEGESLLQTDENGEPIYKSAVLAMEELPVSNKFYQTKNIFNSANQIRNKLAAKNNTAQSLGSNKKINEFLKNAGLESELREQFITLLDKHPVLKKLKISEVLDSYLNEFVKESDRQYHIAINEPLSNELENILMDYFSVFHIRTQELDNLKEKFGVDTIGVFDVLAKTIYYAKERNLLTMPEEYGHVFVELLGSISNKKAKNPLFKHLMDTIEKWDGYQRVFNTYKNVYVTKEGNIDIYKIKKEAIGQAIGIALVRNYKVQKGDQGFWKAIQDVINYVLDLIRGVDHVSLHTTADSIAKDILSRNYDKLNRLQKDTSNYNLLSYIETIETQNKKDGGRALRFMQWFSEHGSIITGSLAYRLQGTVFRPNIDALHDIDLIVGSDIHGIDLDKRSYLSETELENEKIYRKYIAEGNYREAKKYKTPGNIRIDLNKIVETEFFKNIKKQYPEMDWLYTFYGQKANAYYITVNAIWSENQELKDRFKSLNGPFNDRLEHFTEEEIDQMYLFDFFLRPETSKEYTTVEDPDYNLNLAHFNYAFYEKLNMMGRPKDSYDYQMWNYFNEDNILAPDFNDRLVYFQLTPQQQAAQTTRNLEIKDINESEDYAANFDQDYADDTVTDGLFPTIEELDSNMHNSRVAENILKQVSNVTATDYEFISPLEARLITSDAVNPWTGQPAFYYGGKVYFVSSNITAETVFHEFSHPFVRHIKNVNKPLFDRLFTDAVKTEEGQEVLAESIKEYEEVDQSKGIPDIVKEEVIVKSLTKAAIAIKSETPTTKQFDNFIQKAIYHIKQAIRKLFGRTIKVENLHVNTSIKELAEILTGSDKININKEFLTEGNIVAYIESLNRINEDLERLYKNKEDELGIFVDQQFEAIKSLYNTLNEDSKEFGIIKSVLITDANTGLINDMMKLKYFTTVEELDPKRKKAIEDMGKIDYAHQKVSAISKNFLLMDAMLRKISEFMKKAKVDPEQLEVLREIRHYDSLVQSWDKWLSATRAVLQREGLQDDAPLMKHIGELQNLSNIINNDIKSIMTEAVSEATVLMNPINEVLEFRHKQEVERLEKLIKNSSGSAKEAYKNMLREEKFKFERLRLDEDTVKAYLSGAIRRDNSYMNAMFLNYIGNPDPIIGTFGKYLKDFYTEAQTIAFQKANEFRQVMDKLMKDVGYNYNASRLDKLYKDVIFADKKGYIEDGQHYKIYYAPTFRNGYKDYDAVLVKFDFDIQKAYGSWKNTGNTVYKDEFERLVKTRDEHLQKFFQRPYHDMIYQLDDQLLNDVRIVNGKEFKAGEEAKKEIDKLLKQLEDHDISEKIDDPILHLEKVEERAEIWKRYSALFQERDAYGKMKKDEALAMAQALKDHRERKKDFYQWEELEGEFENALRGIESRIEAKLTAPTHMGGLNLSKTDPEYQEKFEEYRNKFIESNIRTKLKDEFYELRGNILNELAKIFEQIEADRIAKSEERGIQYKPLVRFDDIIKDINDVMSGHRDDDGQPVAIDMTKEAIGFVKEMQEKMVDAKKDFAKLNGLNQAEYDELQYYWGLIKAKKKLSSTQQAAFDELREKQDVLAVDPMLKDLLISYWKQLEDLQSKVATEYYVEILDSYYQDFVRAELGESSPSNIDIDFAEDFLDPEFINPFLEKDKDFKQWFKDNHVLTTKYIEGVGSVPYYERLKVWNVIKPNDPKYYETTTLSDGEVINGVPTLKYYRRSVKPVYTDKNGKTTILITGYNPKTKQVELKTGVHKDAKNKWLPLPLEELERKRAENPEAFKGDKDPYDRYIDREYLKMQKENSPAYKVLEKLKEYALKFEENLPKQHRMGYEMPRYRRTGYEHILMDSPTEKVANMWNAIRDQFRQTKDDADEGVNFKDDWKYTSALSGIFAPDEGQIPVSGRFAIDEEQISPDIMKAMVLRMSSIELHKKLDEAHPLAKGYKKLINELNPADVASSITNLQRRMAKLGDFDEINYTKEQQKLNERIAYVQPGDPAAISANKDNRKKAVNAIYEVWWEGKAMANVDVDSLTAGKKTAQHKFVNNMLKMASHRFFALDIQSAFKNFFGAQFQVGTEALLNQTYYNPKTKQLEHLISYKSYTAGRLDAKLADIALAKDIYAKGAQTLSTQMIYLFDAVEGMTEITGDSRIATSFSRSLASDAASLTWMTTHRKYLENNVSLSMFFGAMNHIKVEQKTKDGVKKISYKDAWEINPDTGTIQLKEGIDKDYDINGRMFKLYKNRIHEVNSFNQGMYSKMNSPMANRYLTYRAVISMRKFFLKMFLNRYSYSNQAGGNILNPKTWRYLEEKFDPAIGDFHMGYMAKTFRTIARIYDTNGQYWHHMTKDEKLAAIRFFINPIKSYLFMMLGFMIFGLWDWDPEDPDRWKKLKARSGPLPIPFLVDEDYTKEYPFKPMGWIQNQALAIILSTNAENRFFELSPRSIKAQVNVFDNTSIANTVIVGDLIDVGEYMLNAVAGDKKAYYSKRQGAMWYLQPGEAKYWKILNNMMGIKGKNADPVTALKNTESYLPVSKINKGVFRGIIGY